MQITRDDRLAMERAHVLAWPALRSASVNGWLWRSSGGGSQRANSVSTIDFDGTDPGAAVSEIESRYRAIGQPAKFHTFEETSPSLLPGLLQARGYQQGDPTITMFKPVRGTKPAASSELPEIKAPDLEASDLEASDLEAPHFEASASETQHPEASDIEAQFHPWPAWRDLLMAEIAESRRATNAMIIDRIPAPRRFFACRRDARLVSTAACVIGFRCAVIECVATSSQYRRQGAAQAVLTEEQQWAVRQDVDWIGLQVAAANAQAIRLYQHQGFVPRTTNRFWIEPVDPG